MKRNAVFLLLLAAAGVWQCGMAAEEVAERQAAAKEAAGDFVKQLGGALKDEMAKGGPAAAVKVCTQLAPEIAGKLSREHGWRVTRVSDKVRNPLLGMPDAWEQKVLADFRARAATGEAFDQMTYAEVVEEPQGNYFRFMKAIGIQPVCLACHGQKEQVAAEILATLEENYPKDQATGYSPGDLRGAVSIKQPLAGE
jgi:hypothetical protein